MSPVRSTAAIMVLAIGFPSCGAAGEADLKLITEYDVKRAPWPQVHGPYNNCSAPELGLRLVDDLAKARLVWRSEPEVPCSSPRPNLNKRAEKLEDKLLGGFWGGEYCTPIVADGRVYLSYWRLTGRKNWDITAADKPYCCGGRNPVTAGNSGTPRPETADDILLCVDQATGKTIWEKVVGTGKPIEGYKGGAHMNCAWWDGKVVFVGCNNCLYCLDGKTGDALWTVKNHVMTPAGNNFGPGRGAPTVRIAGGVVYMSRCGYDIATGKVLWKLSKELKVGSEDFGAAWLHGGKSYFILGGNLIEARTGRACWTVPKPSIQGCGPAAVYGDILVTYGDYLHSRTSPEGKHGMTAYRITPEACRELWTSPGCFGHGAQYGSVIIHRGRAIGESTHLKPGGPRVGDGNKGVGVSFDLEKGPADMLAVKDKLRFPTGYSPMAVEGRLLGGSGYQLTMYSLDHASFGAAMGRMQIAECTVAAYAEGRIYLRQVAGGPGGFKVDSRTADPDAEVEGAPGRYRLVCYDLRAE